MAIGNDYTCANFKCCSTHFENLKFNRHRIITLIELIIFSILTISFKLNQEFIFMNN